MVDLCLLNEYNEVNIILSYNQIRNDISFSWNDIKYPIKYYGMQSKPDYHNL